MILTVRLLGVVPPIWRQILVPASITLDALHEVLQLAMGWENSHLHLFRIGGVDYGPEYVEDPPDDERDEREVRLGDLVEARDVFVYEYDFGDCWQHVVVVDKIPGTPRDFVGTTPDCFDGARACPPENCGSAGGYEDFLDAIADRTHPDHDELLRWVGGSFDPERLDLARANRDLRKLWRGVCLYDILTTRGR